MNALASIRNGPLIVISDVPGECPNIFLPLQEMTDILRGPHTAHGTPGPEDPHLPPIYIHHRTTLDPEHFDATKHAAIPPTTLGMPPTTATTLLDATEIPAPPPATFTPPPTIKRRSHHPKLDPNGAHHRRSTQKPKCYLPQEDPPEWQQPIQPARIRYASPQTRRRPQAQITSTPSPKNNHTPYERNTTIDSKKGRPGPVPPCRGHSKPRLRQQPHHPQPAPLPNITLTARQLGIQR